MEDARWSQRLHGWCVSLHFTLSFLQDFSAALQDSGLRATVRTVESLTYRLITDLSIMSCDAYDWLCVVSAVGRYSQYLKQTEVKVISQTDCKSESYYGDRITKNMFCAGSPDWSTDACKVSQGHGVWTCVFNVMGRSIKWDLRSSLSTSWGVWSVAYPCVILIIRRRLDSLYKCWVRPFSDRWIQ